MRKRFRPGFTLLETMLVVANFSIMVLVSVPVILPFYQRNELEVVSTQLTHSLRKANAFARTGAGDSSWGVRMEQGAVTFFKGTSYAARDTTRDETYVVPSWVQWTGMNEVVFAKMTGFPNVTGSVTLDANTNGLRTLTINSKGVVAY